MEKFVTDYLSASSTKVCLWIIFHLPFALNFNKGFFFWKPSNPIMDMPKRKKTRSWMYVICTHCWINDKLKFHHRWTTQCLASDIFCALFKRKIFFVMSWKLWMSIKTSLFPSENFDGKRSSGEQLKA